ncbi:hypothetical protein SSPO_079490 [Streptomyces antimycoticus]|uniref:Alcohol dehydrogenase-like C-terminal domain-containing protein n=1 Tax=Streptomyces antimycoticus TaxID=68175 RepID=A0A499V6U4_9ACTN|nr:zinc-binding dehydrogenase [Streptomyces antimycoticus]BBJ45231.1 hypothetical protein SSPO_079490 [Streptomyces antimycoticus]
MRHKHQRIAAERLEVGSAEGLYDVVIDAAGSETGLARCAELARPGGRVVLLGVYQHTIPIPGIVSLVKELTYVHSIAYSRHDGIRDTEQAAALLAGNPTIAQTVITHRFPSTKPRRPSAWPVTGPAEPSRSSFTPDGSRLTAGARTRNPTAVAATGWLVRMTAA